MELKNYQKKVIADLNRFLSLLNTTLNITQAYKTFWQEQNIPVGYNGVPAYNNIISGTPHICFKVPTGGGKTFLACNSIKPVFDALPFKKAKVVVWLVPSDAILEQTVKCLHNTDHPYRQKIDTDFGGRVEVFTKPQLLNGQNFNPTSVNEQLSILVLSYDSFRSTNKEGRKVYQENGNLAQFPKFYNNPDTLINDADETALIQVINQLSPLIVVDESHHAQSDLSIEMLKNLNPCFVIDLTATPKKNSNIVSYVDALQLKKENMVKLPVIVYNRQSQEDVLIGAIDLRGNLEKAAIEEQKQTGKYIRPIVLFQAQPKGKEDNTTFEKLKQRLISIGIPADEIAIKTSEVNELRNVDLLLESCKIRYIITVNALKEGWDCPFAYILATLANRTSAIDVEQVLGRILRQPYTKQHQSHFLNMSYVLTSSNDFRTTLDKIIIGLNNAGFSSNDYRIAEDIEPEQEISPPVQLGLEKTYEGLNTEYTDDFLAFDAEKVKVALSKIDTNDENIPVNADTAAMFVAALEQGEAYNVAVDQTDGSEVFSQPVELRDKMNVFRISTEYLEEVKELKLPQFFVVIPESLFVDSGYSFLTQNGLSEGFTLKDKDTKIDFNATDEDIVKIDIEGTNEAVPKFVKLGNIDTKKFKEYFSKLPGESKVAACKNMMHSHLNKIDTIDSADLSHYIDRIVESLDTNQLADLENKLMFYIEKIKNKIMFMQAEYCEQQFFKMIDQGKITCRPNYAFKECISPIENISSISKSLYTAEEGNINNFEYKVITSVAALQNIQWWHRNSSRNEFCINGFINHYPDFIVMTTSGKLIVIETKGDYMLNDETKQKIKLGRAWQSASGSSFRYFMVFESKDLNLEGAHNFDSFMEIIKEL